VKPQLQRGCFPYYKGERKRDLLANKFSFLVFEKMFLILRWRLEKYILKSPIFLLKEGSPPSPHTHTLPSTLKNHLVQTAFCYYGWTQRLLLSVDWWKRKSVKNKRCTTKKGSEMNENVIRTGRIV
jgi:hypothetical protein